MFMSAQSDQLLTTVITRESSSFVPTLREAVTPLLSNVFALRLETVPQVSEELNLVYYLKVKTIFSKANFMRPSLSVHHTALQNPTIQPHSRLGAYEGG
jgi:hypothetical protein